MKTAEKKWKLPAEKVKILRWVEKQILAEPKRFNMDSLIDIYSKERVAESHSLPKCGTVACIAGWYTLKATGTLGKDGFWTVDPKVNAWDFAAKELNTFDPDKLFVTSGWPEPFSSKWREAEGTKREAEVAVERIEHFIKTGE